MYVLENWYEPSCYIEKVTTTNPRLNQFVRENGAELVLASSGSEDLKLASYALFKNNKVAYITWEDLRS